MALRLSTKLRQMMMGKQYAYSAATIAAVNVGNKLTDTAKAFITNDFRPGVIFEIAGFTGTPGNNQIAIAGDITLDNGTQSMVVVTEVALVDDALGETVILTQYAQGFKDIFTRGVLCIYTGNQPANADTAPTGTKLLEITEGSAAFVAGSVAAGLRWDAPIAGVIGKEATAWSDTGLATGTAGWFRFYANDFDIGADALCFDGTVGTSGAQLNLSSTAIVLAATTTVDEFEVTLPANA
jgi:hypothetical protein